MIIVVYMSLNNNPNDINYYLERYAIAQYHMGITVTVLAKRHIIGDGYMHDAPIGKLKKLLDHLRLLYKRK